MRTAVKLWKQNDCLKMLCKCYACTIKQGTVTPSTRRHAHHNPCPPCPPLHRCSSGADVSFLSPSQKANLLDMLTALGLLLEQEPRLLGLLTSRSALSPLLAALLPAACALAPPASPPQPPQPSEPLGDEAVAAAATGPAAAAAGGADLAFVDKLAVSSLGFLTKLTQHSGCVEAMVDEEMLRRLCWLLHAPSSYGCLAATLGLLRALLPQPQLAWVAGLQGGAVYLLEVGRGLWRWWCMCWVWVWALCLRMSCSA